MPPPFGCTNSQFVEVPADRAQFFLDRFLEVFSLQA
jgi:hypothetical protein